MNSPIQKIKERLSIEEVVSSYIKLERSGANLKARCPFHNEKTPSFFISPDRGSYYCFGCGAKGDIFTFVEEFEGLDFKGALKLLAEKAGVPLGEFNREEESEKEKLYRIMEYSTKFFENNLSKNQEAMEYLKSRGIKSETVKDFRIGFIPDAWRELYSHLKASGFSDAEMESAGLVKKTEKGFYDRFRGRIIFPISDSSGRVIAFSGRVFGTAADNPANAKYLNSPDTPIFKKSSVLYGIDKAKSSIRKNDFSIVVEGQFDLILSHQAGFKNTVATSGTSLTDSDKSEDSSINSLGMISHLSENIVFVFDSDKAGLAASERATPIGLALFKDMNVKAAAMPPGVDPADLISKSGVDAWREVIRNSKHIIEFLVDKYVSDTNTKDPLKIKLNIEKKIIPYLALIQNPIRKSHFIKIISDKSGIKEEDIIEIINRSQKFDLNQESDKVENASRMFRKDYIEKRLLGIVLWQQSLGEQAFDVDKTLAELSEILNIKPEELVTKTKDNKEDLIFEAEVFYGGVAYLEKEVSELMNNLREESLKEELFRKMQELRVAEVKKDSPISNKILKEINELNNKIHNIKNGRSK